MKAKQFLNKDIVAGIMMILFSLWVMQEAKEFAGAAERFRGVSPALFPRILSVGIILLSCLLIVRGLRKGYHWEFALDFHQRNAYIAVGFIVATILYGLFMEFLGFLLVTSLYTLIFIIWMKGASPIRAVVIALGTVGLIYFVFHTLMFVPFPRGEILESIGW